MLTAQIAAVIIFIIMFGLVITEKIERHIITLLCGVLTLIFVFGVCMHSGEAVVKTINVNKIFTQEFWYEGHSHKAEATEEKTEAEETEAEETETDSGINWATIIFIAGMMVMVEGMARVGFFRYLCMTIARLVKYKTIPVFITFMIMSSVLAMFIDSITVILFLAAVTVELAQLLRFNPIPMILSEIFCANLGGSATMCGDPPNIIVGTSLGYTFGDFITNTGLIALVGLVVVIFYFYFVFRKVLVSNGGGETANVPDTKVAIEDKPGFALNTIIFLIAVVLLVSHAQTGLTVAFIGAFIAILSILASGRHAGEILKKVDYKTLLFFIGLFVVVGGLEQTGILVLIADFIAAISGGNARVMIAIVIWISAIASAFIDNIPFAATMIPVIQNLSALTGLDLHTLAWSLSVGTDIGGSATPIGASANVVGTSVAAKAGYPVGWGNYCKALAPATVIVLVIATAVIWLRYL